MSTVLVTGGSGFIGVPLVHDLLARGHEVHVLSRRPPGGADAREVSWQEGDLLDPAGRAQAIERTGAQQLVHLAWYVSHGSFWSAAENVQWVEASLGLLRAFAERGGRRALLVGSCAEYAWGGEADLDEETSRLEPRTRYGICKDAFRRVAETYADAAGIEVVWARLFFLYGPREQPERLVPAVVRSLLAGERIPTSSGEQVRDFLHVHDAAAALGALLDCSATGAVNVGSGRATPVSEVLDLLGALTGAGDLIDRGARATPAAEPARIVASVRRLVDATGFRPALSLEQGLAQTVQWWRELQARPSSSGPAAPPR